MGLKYKFFQEDSLSVDFPTGCLGYIAYPEDTEEVEALEEYEGLQEMEFEIIDTFELSASSVGRIFTLERVKDNVGDVYYVLHVRSFWDNGGEYGYLFYDPSDVLVDDICFSRTEKKRIEKFLAE